MSRRTDRLGELFREEISKLLQKGLKDPRVGFATISRVDITEDLSYAKVLVSVMGSEKEKRDTLIGLKNSSGFIRRGSSASSWARASRSARFPNFPSCWTRTSSMRCASKPSSPN